MSKKAEQTFLSTIGRDFKDSGYHFYKIPDTLGMSFTLPKPFDCYISVDGRLGGMEAKAVDMNDVERRDGTVKKGRRSLRWDDLRANQHEGLEDVLKVGGVSFVFYEVKIGKEFRFYSFMYPQFKELCFDDSRYGRSIPLSVLETLPYAKRELNRYGSHSYDLTHFLAQWIEAATR